MKLSGLAVFFIGILATATSVYSIYKKDRVRSIKNSVKYYLSMATDAKAIDEQVSGHTMLVVAYRDEIPNRFREVLQWLFTQISPLRLWIYSNARGFVKKYGIKMNDFAPSDINAYKNFREFFYRKLAAGKRLIDVGDDVVTSVADCRLRVMPNVTPGTQFYIKQEPFNVTQFLGDPSLAKNYTDGSLMVFRLAPTDYHRFHFPFSGTIKSINRIRGKYESVNPVAYRKGMWPISRNKRVLVILEPDNKDFGDEVAMMIVGAAAVGSIKLGKEVGDTFTKNDELGYFDFGGSTICLLFKKETVAFPDVLLNRSKMGANDYAAYETYVKVFQGVATSRKSSLDANGLSSSEYVEKVNSLIPGELSIAGKVFNFTLNKAVGAVKYKTYGRA